MANFNRIVKLIERERIKNDGINIDFDCLNFNQIDYLIPVHFIAIKSWFIHKDLLITVDGMCIFHWHYFSYQTILL